MEAGRAELKIDDLIRLCQYYDLSADYLMGLIAESDENDESVIDFHEQRLILP